MRKSLLGVVLVLLTTLLWGAGYGAQSSVRGPQEQTQMVRTPGPSEAERLPALGYWLATRFDDSASGAYGASQRTAGMPGATRDGHHGHSPAKYSDSLPAKGLSVLPNYISLSSRGDNSLDNCLGDFTITAYTNGVADTGKQPGDPGYGVTASGATATANKTIAADWNVLPKGTRLHIEGLPGEYVVQDTGGAVKGRHVDVFMNTEQEAIAWGVKERKISIVEWGGT